MQFIGYRARVRKFATQFGEIAQVVRAQDS